MYDVYYDPMAYWNPSKPELARAPKHLSVLVVEDDLQMQKYFSHILKTIDKNLSVDRVATAEEAKDLLDHSEVDHYDLVIADQFLSGTDTGLDLWNHCRKKHPFVQFMLTSGTEIDRYLARFHSTTQIPVFLKKSLSAQSMRAKIMEVLRQVRTLGPLGQVLRGSRIPEVWPASDTLSIRWTSQESWGLSLVLYSTALAFYSTLIFSSYDLSFSDVMRDPSLNPQRAPAGDTLNPWEEELKTPQTPKDWRELKDLNLKYPERAQIETYFKGEN